MNMPRDSIINEALGIHKNAAYTLHSWLKPDTQCQLKGNRLLFTLLSPFSHIFAATLFPCRYRIHALLEQWAISCTTLFFIHLDVYLSHDGAIKENICQLCSRSTYPSQVAIVVSNDTTFWSECVSFFSFVFSLAFSLFLILYFFLHQFPFTLVQAVSAWSRDSLHYKSTEGHNELISLLSLSLSLSPSVCPLQLHSQL